MRGAWITVLLLAALVWIGCPSSDDDVADDDGGDDDGGDDDGGDDDGGDDDGGDDDTAELDADGDGFTPADGDCDDGDAAVFPGAEELCNGVDDDCDGTPDDDCLDCDVVVPTMVVLLQDAIVGAADGDVICLRPGTYAERIDFQQKSIEVRGLEGPEVTIIEGNDQGPTVIITGGQGPDTVLEGVTVTGGTAVQGGGLFLNGSSPTLRALHVVGNVADLGGGMFIDAGAAPHIDGVRLIDNWATGDEHEGGGMYISSASPTVTNTAILDNHASEGGGVRLTYSQATFDHVVFAGNGAGKGGGLFATNAEPLLTNVVFAGNTASDNYSGGGGLYLIFADAVFTNVSFVGNEATDVYGNGGGLKISASAPTLTNVLVAHNEAGWTGAGLDNDGDPVFRHSAFFDNDVDGGGITFGQDGNVEGEAPLLLDHADPDPFLWDLHLGAASSLVDAGDPALLDPDGTPSDIGAYGGPAAPGFDRDLDTYPEWWLPGPYDPATSPTLDCDDHDPAEFPGSGC